MPTQQNFDGQTLIIPGVYSNIKSGFKNPPSPLSAGNLLIIDTGSGAGAGGGAGVNGTITNGSDAVYSFDNIEDFQSFVEKNLWWFLADPLFNPLTENGIKALGVSKIDYIKAATTAPALMQAIFGDNASDSVGNAVDIRIKVRSEGLVGNGVLGGSGNDLSKGYAFKLIAGVMDTTKVIMNFYRGTFKGLDQNGNPFDGIAQADSKAELLCQSPEFNLASVLIDWMNTNTDFNEFFKYDASQSSIGHGHIDSSDLADYTNYTLAYGGTESFGTSDLTAALAVAKSLNVDFVLCDKFGSNSRHANNTAIFNWAVNTSRFKPQVYIASGSVVSEFSTSLSDAVYYDSQQITVVHGGPKISATNAGFNNYDSYYKAANLLGREAGLAPQVPLTFKNISIDGERHVLNDIEKAKALKAGVLVSYPDNGVFEVLKGVNSLQKNTFPLNDDGTTHSKQLYRIAHQLNKEILITAKAELLKNPDGTNRNTLSELDVQQWLKRFLAAKVAQPTADNLILSFQDIVVTRTTDAYRITYKFGPNTEISFLLFTGLMIDIN